MLLFCLKFIFFIKYLDLKKAKEIKNFLGMINKKTSLKWIIFRLIIFNNSLQLLLNSDLKNQEEEQQLYKIFDLL